MSGSVIPNTKKDARMGNVEQLYLWVVESSLPTSNRSQGAQYSRVGEQGESASTL